MKYTAPLILLLSALTTAQSPSRSAITATSSTEAPTSSVSLSPVAACINRCSPGDVNCQAACVGSSHPNAPQANATNDCAAQCKPGTGSGVDNAAYARCVAGCISSHFPTTGTATAAAGSQGTGTGTGSGGQYVAPMSTGSSGGGDGNGGSGNDNGGESGSGASASATGSATATGGAGAASSSGAAGGALGVPVGGLVAVGLAVLAL